MNLLYKNFLSCFALFCLCGCYKNAEDSFIDDHFTIIINDTTQYDRQNISQNLWTYAQMQEYYLWEEFMPDSASLNFINSPTTFFQKLKYKGDRFSWIERNPGYRGSTLYDRFGIETISYLLPTGGEIYRVALVLPFSPAEIAGLRRDDWFIIIHSNDGKIDIETGKMDGTVFRPEKKLTLSENEKNYTDAVALDTVYLLQDKKIGYLFYNSFQDGLDENFTYPYRLELQNIFGNFKKQGITDLIIDLRYNPGGYVSIEEIMCGLILPDEYLGEIAGYFSFNRIQAAKRLQQTGSEEEIKFFPNKSRIGDNNLEMRKVYFIITRRSASASEALINALEPCISVITIGSTSTGKNVGSYTLESRNYEWKLQPITFYYYNRAHITIPETGIVPDIPVDENNATWYDIGDTRELLLSVALEQITGETQLRSAVEYGNIRLTPADDGSSQRRKLEGLLKIRNYE